MKIFLWISIFFAINVRNGWTTGKPAKDTTLSPPQSTNGITPSIKQSSTTLSSTLLNGLTTAKTGSTSAQNSSTIRTSTASQFTSGVTSSVKQSSTTLSSTSLNGLVTIQSSKTLTSTSLKAGSYHNNYHGEDDQSKLLIITLVTVVTVLVITAILIAVFIRHRRRCKKPAGDEASKEELTNEKISHDITGNKMSPLNYDTVVTSSYEMNDQSLATYSMPARKEKDDSVIAKNEKKNGGRVASDEYDRIDFDKKCDVTMPGYDSLPAIEVQKFGGTCFHESGDSKRAFSLNAKEYSRCHFEKKDSQSNDYTKISTLVSEPPIVDNYSHVDLGSDRTVSRHTSMEDEDSYNHIDLNKATLVSVNGEVVSVRTMQKSEQGYQKFKEDLQSFDVNSKLWPADDKNPIAFKKDPPLQDLKAVSLPDKYIEFKIGDIYDTPVCKEQQYACALKRSKEQLFNSTGPTSIQKSATAENNDGSKDCTIESDYELAKSVDF